MLTTLRDGVLDLLFPPRCEICHTLQEPVICADCRMHFTPVSDPICRQCGLPLDSLARTAGHCAECREEPPPFDVARSAGLYHGALRRAIHLYKYNLVRALANPLGDYIAEQVELPFPIDCLCPVPLHPSRERVRGFNQSMLLAERLGVHWNIPVDARTLVRTQPTTPQMLLPRNERLQQIKNVFAAEQPLQGRAVCVVDDVFTTGATLRECSRVLRRAGAGRILVISLARTVERIASLDDER